MPASIDEITRQATTMVRAKTGDPGARIIEVTPLPGHAGFGYSFILERTTPGGPSGKLVLRVAPEGVRIAGPADVVRQARIMKSLADTDVPVPPILWHGDEAEFFGRPYFVDGFVDGFKLADVVLPAEEARAYARTGIETLATLHRVPWEPRRDAWGSVTELSEEMKRLDHLLDRDTLDPKVVARGPELREKLRSSLPANPRVGIVHGDFQFSNILFNDHQVSAVIDWEISMIGPTLLDLGWISFFADRASFVENGTVQTATPLTPGRNRRHLLEERGSTDSGRPSALVPRLCGISFRRHHLFQRDVASAWQARRPALGRHRAVRADDVFPRA